MNRSEIDDYIVAENSSIIDAMKQIDKNTAGLVFVTDSDGKLSGCLTDGNVRRWIIKNGKADGPVSEVMNHDPKYVHEDQRDLAIALMRKWKIYSVAVVDNNHRIVDIIFDRSALQTITIHVNGSISDIPVIIMAGGKGTRLYPYTKILPKPLIPIGEVPIIERILDQFNRYGISKFWISVNYKKEMIKSYFSELSKEYDITYIEEDMPLGTAGSIGLVRESFDRPVIISNCDSLIDADYVDVVRSHEASNNDMTIISSIKNVSIPYGVLYSGEDGLITAMEEKPRLSYFINTGMYVINPEFIQWIPKGQVFHMTQLADMMIQKGKRVGMYPIGENSFLDMGEFEEMRKMEERISQI